MPIPDHLVEEVRQRADIVEIVSEHTRLKRTGRTFRGPCPLHGGEGPNFSVDPGKGLFKCFVCGEGGTVYTFLMKHLGMTYPEAIRWTAARLGIEIPEREERREEDPNRPFFEVNSFAAQWFRKQLWEGDEGREARAYLEKRGITRASAERFGLGWAPEAWTAFGDAARKHGISNELLLTLGLAKESKSGGSREPYDAFRGRVIFPIEDLGGRVLAFGGRILGSAEEHVPKYLNSPESPIYHKGSTLYGLGWSRGAIRKEETALVVEGYMDYVSLASHGVENVVAPLGTAMTEEQAELIARYTQRAILLYDSDKAGLKATFRSGDALLRAGVAVLVATLPDGEDPDSLVRSKGPAVLRKYLDDAVDVLERKIQILERRDYFSTFKGVRQAIDALLPTVRATADEVTRSGYVGLIAEKTRVTREALEKEVAEAAARDGLPATAAARRRDRPYAQREGGGPAPQRPREDPGYASRALVNPERILLLLMLQDDSWVERAAQSLGPQDFQLGAFQQIYAGLLATEGRDPNDPEWIENFPPEVRPLVEELRGSPEARTLAPADKFFEGSLHLIRARAIRLRLDDVQRRIEEAGFDGDLSLLREKRALADALRDEDGRLRKAGLRSGTA